MKFITTLFLLLGTQFIFSQEITEINGTVTDVDNNPIPFASVYLPELKKGNAADADGKFTIKNIPYGLWQLSASAVGYKASTITINPNEPVLNGVRFQLAHDNELDQVEVFGNRNDHPDKIESITRLPLKPYEQIQSISVLSEKLIEDQGALTISEATKNVPGVYTFATYGNKRESMSSRGFRGIPILKNGVRIHSDFRGVGILTDMQGVDNIQVLKGTASITQGVATDLGSPGGVINIVTKTPKYYTGGNASIRLGSFGQARTTFDVFGPIDKTENLAFRINGALERADSFRSGVSSDRFYINPSFEWKVDPKSTITLEMDYFDDSRTPDLGTVNLAENDINAIYNLPSNQFLGYNNDKSLTKNATYSVRFNRDLTDKLSLKAALYTSSLNLDDKGASLGAVVKDGSGNAIYNQRKRGYSTSTRNDDNSVLQFDLVGDDLKTGRISHTFQVGFDYRTTKFGTTNQSISTIDTIDVFTNNTRMLPNVLAFGVLSESGSASRALGIVAQDVITFNKWLKTFMGFRYSTTQTDAETETTESDAFNPLAGIIVIPIENINVFVSYTNSSYPRTGTRLDSNGKQLGNERFDQFETGIKTNWLESRLRLNFTFFKINNKDINLPVYDENWV
ncbi:MAG: TonB-dependent receptor, partial [Aequorivita sp.]|nr:TonB-dependent receptor [Aequorivita sp.]